MKPSDLSLPSRFTDWYPGQEDAVAYILSSQHRFTILNMPTGVGKSAVAMAVGSALDGRTAVLTSSRPLQYQYEDDFVQMGLMKLMGQNNYPCRYFEGSRRVPGCDEGPCHAGVECALRECGCLYYDAVRESLRHPSVVFNYRHWMTVNRYSEPDTLGPFDTLVLDEAHDAAEHLADFVQITIDYSEVRTLLGLDVPRHAPIDEWVEWAQQDALTPCRARLAAAKAQTALYPGSIDAMRRLRDLEQALTDLANARSWQRTDASDPSVWIPGAATDWITEEGRIGITFSPVWASGYAERYLFRDIQRVVLLSATISERDAVYIGIPKSQYSYRAFNSPFRKEIRPVLVFPACSVRREMSLGEERQWINRIDSIIEFEGAVKGVIHSVSYKRGDFIRRHSRFGSLMILPQEVHGRREVRQAVEQFKASRAPCILVAPSVETGYDFPYDFCDYQIIAKVPFIDQRPAVIQARARADKRYLDHVAMVRVIQMAGRGVRAADDWCRCWIIDSNWSDWFYPRNKDLVPPWFKQAIRRVTNLADVEPRRTLDGAKRSVIR